MVRAMSGQIEPDKTSPLPMMVVKTCEAIPHPMIMKEPNP